MHLASGDEGGCGIRIDHVIYAVDDLDAAAKRFRDELGLDSVPGGRHPGWGTANRIVPLGREYLELIAVADRAVAAASDFGRRVLEAAATGQRLVGWMVQTDDIYRVASRLDLEVVEGSRMKPDGSRLAWRLAGVGPALSTGALPAFIEWDAAPGSHPGAAVAEHASRPHGFAWLELSAEEPALQDWLGDHDLPLRLAGEGPPRLTAVAIGTDPGEIVLR